MTTQTQTPTAPYYQGPALRVANTIGTVKILLVTILGAISSAASLVAIVVGFKVESAPVALSGVAGLVVGALWLVLVWVVLGWFEHVLRVLVAVANNGRR